VQLYNHILFDYILFDYILFDYILFDYILFDYILFDYILCAYSDPLCSKRMLFNAVQQPSSPPGDVVWLSAAFKPKFSGTSATVSFTSSTVTINGATFPVPDSFIQLTSSLQTCGTAEFVSGEWQAAAPLPGSGNTFLSAVSVTVPSGANWANAQVTWCGSVTAPGEIDV
jgi:hypothetical protein